MLALRPCAKSEIIQKFSIPEKDKESFDLLLQAVANFNQKTLKYDIANEIFLNEVKEDWQFYNPNERANVKQNLNRVKQNMINSNLNQPAKAQSSLGSSSFNLNSKASANSAFFRFSNHLLELTRKAVLLIHSPNRLSRYHHPLIQLRIKFLQTNIRKLTINHRIII